MKNATIEDVKRAQETGVLEETIMYSAHGWLVHGKKQNELFTLYCTEGFQEAKRENRKVIICEKADGELVTVFLDRLEPTAVNEQPKQPRQPKRKPQKGTKPFTEIPVSENNPLDFSKLPKGAKVRFRNGKTTRPYKKEHRTYVDGLSALFWKKDAHFMEDEYSIISVLLPFKEASSLKPSKSKEQEAFEQGKWVPFVASETSTCPAWVTGKSVEVLCSHGVYGKGRGEYMWWNSGSSIVAYRKA